MSGLQNLHSLAANLAVPNCKVSGQNLAVQIDRLVVFPAHERLDESMRCAGFAKRRSNEDSEAVDGELLGCCFTNDGTQHFVEGGGEPCGFEWCAA